MSGNRPLKIGIVAGEESGDLLGADLVRALQRLSGREVQLVGTGGRHLQELGLSPLFDAGEIALMGISAVLRDLPRLIRRIGETARAVVAEKPDCLITIDSPDFTLRVAKKVRALDPSIPIVHYVCPSVWAWRPGRAPAMKPYVDHILCLLPFEGEALKRLGGPPGTYVGHRLTQDDGVKLARSMQDAPRDLSDACRKILLVLPGSRKGEVRLPVYYNGRRLGASYRIDFLCFDSIVVELKALASVGRPEAAQLLNYLKVSGSYLGLLLNFGARRLEYRRVVWGKPK